MPTEFIVHAFPSNALLEVAYPATFTLEAFVRYEARFREAAMRLPTSWSCLVDLRAVSLLPPDVGGRGLALTRWAHAHGLVRMARVVAPSALAALQARRMLREGGLEEGLVFQAPEEARRALAELARTASSLRGMPGDRAARAASPTGPGGPQPAGPVPPAAPGLRTRGAQQ